MEYIREMLLRQRTALGRLMLGGGSAEEPETAAASPATERTSPAAPAPWETDGTASGTGGWEIRGTSRSVSPAEVGPVCLSAPAPAKLFPRTKVRPQCGSYLGKRFVPVGYGSST